MNSISLAFALLAAPLSAAAPAQPPQESGPQEAIAEAFNDTCRRGFPDVDLIGRHAAASGWVERSSRLIAERSDPALKRMIPPRFFQRGEFTLIVMKASSFVPRPSCSVSLRVGKEIDLNSVAGAVSHALGTGAPAMVRIDRAEHAQWRPTQALLVDASIQKGNPRTVHLVVRTDP